jgi:Cu/Ag efflux pump CusA
VVTPKLPVLAQYGISFPDFQNQLQANLDGNVAGNIFDNVHIRLYDFYLMKKAMRL